MTIIYNLQSLLLQTGSIKIHKTSRQLFECFLALNKIVKQFFLLLPTYCTHVNAIVYLLWQQ